MLQLQALTAFSWIRKQILHRLRDLVFFFPSLWVVNTAYESHLKNLSVKRIESFLIHFNTFCVLTFLLLTCSSSHSRRWLRSLNAHVTENCSHSLSPLLNWRKKSEKKPRTACSDGCVRTGNVLFLERSRCDSSVSHSWNTVVCFYEQVGCFWRNFAVSKTGPPVPPPTHWYIKCKVYICVQALESEAELLREP